MIPIQASTSSRIKITATPAGVAGFVAAMGLVVCIQVFAVTQLSRDVELALLILVFALVAPKRLVAAAIGVAVVASMDAIPLFKVVGGQRRSIPIVCLMLCIGLIVRRTQTMQIQPRRIGLWTAVMAFVVMVGVVRPSYFGAARTLENSLDVSTATLILVVGAPMLAFSLRDDGIWRIAGAILGGSVVLQALLRDAFFAIGDPPGLITSVIHPTIIRSISGGVYSGGVARVINPADHLLGWAVCLLLAFTLIGPSRYRRAVVGLGLVTALAFLLTYTRAFYVAAAITVIWTLGFGLKGVTDTFGQQRFRNVRTTLIALAGALLAVSVVTGQGGSFVSRFTESFSGAADHSAQIRQQAISILLSYMRGLDVWLFGRGYQSPLDHYDLRLELAGGMYNTDLGFAAVVMPLGLVGLAGIIAGVISLARSSNSTLRLVSEIRESISEDLRPILLGTTSFCVFFIATGTTVYLSMDGAQIAIPLAFAVGINALTEAVAALNGRCASSDDSELSESSPQVEPMQLAQSVSRR